MFLHRVAYMYAKVCFCVRHDRFSMKGTFLEVFNVQREDEDVYHCLVVKKGGTKMSADAKLSTYYSITHPQRCKEMLRKLRSYI